MTEGLVSVIIPTYNRGDTIKRALDSIKNQSYSSIEIIIVDDGGDDNTDKILKDYDFGDIPHVCIRHEHNAGPGAARNTGMIRARGEYLAFIDSDDEWCNNDKIKMQVHFLRNNLDYALVATAHLIMNSNSPSMILHFTNDDSFRKVALKYCPAHTSTWLFRRALFQEIGGFWLHGAEDYEYLLRIGCRNKCFCIPVVTEKYFNSPKGDYENNITRNFIWIFCVFVKYSFQYPYFFSSLTDRIFRLSRRICCKVLNFL